MQILLFGHISSIGQEHNVINIDLYSMPLKLTDCNENVESTFRNITKDISMMSMGIEMKVKIR